MRLHADRRLPSETEANRVIEDCAHGVELVGQGLRSDFCAPFCQPAPAMVGLNVADRRASEERGQVFDEGLPPPDCALVDRVPGRFYLALDGKPFPRLPSRCKRADARVAQW